MDRWMRFVKLYEKLLRREMMILQNVQEKEQEKKDCHER